MTNEDDGVELNSQELLELTAVKAGLKPVLRLERAAEDARRIEKRLLARGLILITSDFHVIQRRLHPLGDVFSQTVRGAASGRQRGIFYVAPRSHAVEAQALARIESADPGSSEIGLRLGYPPCCVAAYEDIQSGRDWVEAMLSRTPEGSVGFAACNRLARLFGGWTLLPDYFPCSFACSTSATWSAEIVRSVSDRGMLEYVAAAKAALAIPISVCGTTITQLAPSLLSVSFKTKITTRRTLRWVSPS
jgi:hypothetical protein